MKIRKPIVGLFLLLFGGCASASSELREVLLEDVRQAKFMAEQSDDQLALKCWSHLEGVEAARVPTVDAGEPAGVLSTYQRVRDARRTVRVGASDQLKLECGPMLFDSKMELGRHIVGMFFF